MKLSTAATTMILATASLAEAGGKKGKKGGNKSFTIWVESNTNTTKTFQLDSACTAACVGTTFYYSSPVFSDETKTTQVGKSEGVCAVVGADLAYTCTWTNTFSDTGAAIQVQGKGFLGVNPALLSIVGGTMEYEGASGTLSLDILADGTGVQTHDFTV